jgi:hypothetical protein
MTLESGNPQSINPVDLLLIFHGYGEYYLVGRKSVESGRSPPMFQRSILPSFSRLKNKPRKKTARSRQFLLGLTFNPGDGSCTFL